MSVEKFLIILGCVAVSQVIVCLFTKFIKFLAARQSRRKRIEQENTELLQELRDLKIEKERLARKIWELGYKNIEN